MAKEIPLSKGKFAVVDDADYEHLMQWKWKANPEGYAVRNTSQEGKMSTILMHRFIVGTPKGMVTDHINRNILDNRRENLRVCTSSQNRVNAKKRQTKNKYKGVYQNLKKNKYYARIVIEGMAIHLGTYEKEEDAALAYNNALTKYFGKHVYLNEVA